MFTEYMLCSGHKDLSFLCIQTGLHVSNSRKLQLTLVHLRDLSPR